MYVWMGILGGKQVTAVANTKSEARAALKALHGRLPSGLQLHRLCPLPVAMRTA